MLPRRANLSGAPRSGGTWGVLLLLLAAVLTPTACVLWFMSRAVSNERLAVRQRLRDFYRQQAEPVREKIDRQYAALLADLDQAAKKPTPAQAFASAVRAGLVDGAVIYSADGSLAYPSEAAPAFSPGPPDVDWLQAERLEDEQAQPAEAAKRFAAIAAAGKDADRAARAYKAQARCLLQAGRKHDALGVLTGPLAGEALRNATDVDGRAIQPAGLLLAAQLLRQAGQPDKARPIEQALQARLNDYAAPLPASQRRFLMGELRALWPQADLPTQPAETVAAEYAELSPVRPPGAGPLQPTARPGVWRIQAGSGRLVALIREDRLRARLQAVADAAGLTGARLKVEPAGRQSVPAEPLVALDLGSRLPGWRLAVRLQGDDPFSAAAHRQILVYAWTGGLGISAVVILALLVARHVGRQMKLTRLKNDLIATVSHELKTPLASMRVLVDTLREGRCASQQQADEYLALVAKENQRLSRLIDDFLAFSRMERNKAAFKFASVDVAHLAREAAQVANDRLCTDDCEFTLEIQPDLPAVTGDHDGLLTVLLNLLENACKYSGSDKRIALRVYQAAGMVCLAVSDNGLGLSRREAKKVFDRFYQVDRSLSRQAGGVGLGLSIVEFIVSAHGGTISVRSAPGKGSTFTVRLDPARPASAREE